MKTIISKFGFDIPIYKKNIIGSDILSSHGIERKKINWKNFNFHTVG